MGRPSVPVNDLVRKSVFGNPDELVNKALSYEPPPEDNLPIIPYRAKRREMDLNEMANAGVVGAPKETGWSRLGNELEGAAATSSLDPNAESGMEAFLGSALQSYTGARSASRQFEDRGNDIDAQITASALARRRQAGLDYESGRTRAFQQFRDYAGGVRDLAAAKAAEETPDVNGISAALRAAGYSDVARYVDNNPREVSKNPGPFMTLLHPGPLPSEIPPEVTEATRRVSGAESFSASNIAQEQRSSDPDVQEKVASPEGVRARREELTRLHDPGFAEDSTLARTVSQYRRSRKTVSPTPKPAPAKVDDHREVQAVAKQFDPTKVPLTVAVRALRAPEVSPPWTDIQLRRILSLSGYTTPDVEKVLGKPRPPAKSGARF